MSRETTIVEDLRMVTETDMAILVVNVDDDDDDADAGIWIPKSQIEDTDRDEPGDEGYIEIPEWLADEKGLV